jgi:hydrogenase expression/formation protein HypE
VVPRGCADRIFINTAGIGLIPEDIDFSVKKIRNGDKIILSGTMGDHGTAILLDRENLKVQSHIESDCAPLNLLLQPVTRRFSG